MRALHKRALLLAAATMTAAAAVLGVASGPVAAESNGGIRVMPLGDSITEGTQVPGGYRIGLWQRLAAAQYRVDFVGSEERRVGKECSLPCRSRWSPYH